MPHPDPFSVRALLGQAASVCRRATTGEHGVALPPLIDHHVHSHLADIAALGPAGIAVVLDLGGDPGLLARQIHGGMPHMEYAGAFLTAVGGYPVGRSWAPAGIVREVRGHAADGVRGGAETAVDEQAEFGASVIKVSLNADAGPVFDRATVDAIVARAHSRGLPVVAHAQGDGMTAFALEAGVDGLAHTPFTEIVPPALIARAVAADQVWISTLAIHGDGSDDLERAASNLGAFAAAGGRVLYGTDLGNGPLSHGVNPRELHALDRAGVHGGRMIAALTDPWPSRTSPSGVATFIAGAPPVNREDVADWLPRARVVPTEELIHDGN